MDAKAIYERLVAQFGSERILPFRDDAAGDPFVLIRPESVRDVIQFLRAEPSLDFDFLALITGVDYPEHLAVVYHLFSYSQKHRLVLKVELPKDSPRIDSVEPIWPTANWHERETFDLLGVEFIGHSNLRRILLPEDWEGHPLRKDYKQPDEYHGISNW
jgi:NADH-quinone oxidoreductase subunit C